MGLSTLIIRWAAKKHIERVDLFMNFIRVSKELADELKREKQLIFVERNINDIEDRERRIKQLEKEILPKRNMLIYSILENRSNFKLKKKDGSLIDERYLEEKSVEELIEISEKILEKIRNLEFKEG